jgi:hypothetical protein
MALSGVARGRRRRAGVRSACGSGKCSTGVRLDGAVRLGGGRLGLLPKCGKARRPRSARSRAKAAGTTPLPQVSAMCRNATKQRRFPCTASISDRIPGATAAPVMAGVTRASCRESRSRVRSAVGRRVARDPRPVTAGTLAAMPAARCGSGEGLCSAVRARSGPGRRGREENGCEPGRTRGAGMRPRGRLPSGREQFGASKQSIFFALLGHVRAGRRGDRLDQD